MVENNNIKTKLTFDDNVIKKIAGITVQQVDGIISLNGGIINELTNSITGGPDDPTKGVSVDVGEKQVSLKLNASIEYGTSAGAIFKEVTRKVAQSIKEMTDLELIQLELHIDDIKTKDELNSEKKDESAK